MLESFPTPEKPWNRRWAILLKPGSTSSKLDSKNPDSSDLSSHAVHVKAEKPKMIGIVGTPRKGELAYKINPGYWGKGYMSETLTMFLDMFWGSEGMFNLRIVSRAHSFHLTSFREFCDNMENGMF